LLRQFRTQKVNLDGGGFRIGVKFGNQRREHA